VNKAEQAAKAKGYDVFILPGGSCVPKILKTNNYEGIIGVACGEESKMSLDLLSSMNVAGQCVPLLRNGCANTTFNMDALTKTL
jgi:hypothetical protein